MTITMIYDVLEKIEDKVKNFLVHVSMSFGSKWQYPTGLDADDGIDGCSEHFHDSEEQKHPE